MTHGVKVQLDENLHLCSITELCAYYDTDETDGLTWSTAKDLLLKHGKNLSTADDPDASCPVVAVKSLCTWFTSLLWIALVLSLLMNLVCYCPCVDYVTPVSLITVLAVEVLLSEKENWHHADSSEDRVPQQMATVIRGGVRAMVLAVDLVVGDLLVVKKGDLVSADMRIVESQDLTVNDLLLTGRMQPKRCSNKATSHDAMVSENMVFYPSTVVGGSAKGVVVRTGDRAGWNRSARASKRHATAAAQLNPLGCATYVLLIITALCLAGLAPTGSIIGAIHYVVLSVLPLNILIILRASKIITYRAMIADGCLVKNSKAVETLGFMHVICCEKSEYLTQNKFIVRHLWYNMKTTEVLNGWQVDVEERTSPELQALCRSAVLCADANLLPSAEGVEPEETMIQSSELEKAILQCMDSCCGGNASSMRQSEPSVWSAPPSSCFKFKVAIRRTKEEMFLVIIMGSPERVIKRCTTVVVQGNQVQIDEQMKTAIDRQCIRLANTGETVLAIAERYLRQEDLPHDFNVSLEVSDLPLTELQLVGLVSLVDPPRGGSAAAVAKCKASGVRVLMLTEEHPLTALSLAKRLDIFAKTTPTIQGLAKHSTFNVSEGKVPDNSAALVEGWRLNSMTSTELLYLLARYKEIVFCRLTLTHKLRIVEMCWRNGWNVAVTGSVPEDLVVMKRANLSIASKHSRGWAKCTADYILPDGSFSYLVTNIALSRNFYHNLTKSVALVLATAVPDIAVLLARYALKMPVPISLRSVLSMKLVVNLWPAIALSKERSEPKLNERGLGRRTVLSRQLLFFALAEAGVVEAAAGLASYITFMDYHGWETSRLIGLVEEWDCAWVPDLRDSNGEEWTYGERKFLEYRCQSHFFLCIVVVQIAHTIVCKTKLCSAITSIKHNHLLNVALLCSSVLAVIVSPLLNPCIEITDIDLWFSLLGFPFAFLYLLVQELRKKILRKYPNCAFLKETYF